MNAAAHATAPGGSAADLSPAKLLRRRGTEPLRAFGETFVVCGLPDGWSAAACTSAHPDGQTLDIGATETSRDDWKEALRSIHDSISATGSERLHKYSPSGQVAELDIDWPGRGKIAVICKQGHVDSITQRFGTYFKGPKEWREFWVGHRLLELGLPAPRPLACFWRRAGMLHLQGQIVTEFVADALPLDRAIRKLDAATERYRRSASLDTLTCRMAEVLRTVGDNRLYHRDLKVGNVLVACCETDPQPWLIDLDGVGTESGPHGPRFCGTLARLGASLSESTELPTTRYVRALKQIMAGRERPAANWRSAWRDAQHAAVRMSKQRRSRRKTAELQ